MNVSEYRAHPAQNYSSLKHILTSPAHYLAALTEKREETVPMRLGTMLHSWWLEGKKDVLGDGVVRPADLDGRTKEGKEWTAKHEGMFILTDEEWCGFQRRQAALTDRPDAKAPQIANALLSVMPEREKPMLGEIEGVQVKALFDACSACAFLDLKTCQKNDPKAWGEQVESYHYDFQVALYSEILRQNTDHTPAFYWVTVSSDTSPVVAVYEPGPFEERGREKLRRAIAAYKELMQYGEQPLVPTLPYWLAAAERRAA